VTFRGDGVYAFYGSIPHTLAATSIIESFYDSVKVYMYPGFKVDGAGGNGAENTKLYNNTIVYNCGGAIQFSRYNTALVLNDNAQYIQYAGLLNGGGASGYDSGRRAISVSANSIA
jgi:hypothetical protein